MGRVKDVDKMVCVVFFLEGVSVVYTKNRNVYMEIYFFYLRFVRGWGAYSFLVGREVRRFV